MSCRRCSKNCPPDLVDHIGSAGVTLDHVTPRELGGSNHESNLVTCCLSCNSAKQDLPLRKFLRVLADRGVDTTKIARRIRTVTRRTLDRKGAANKAAAKKQAKLAVVA